MAAELGALLIIGYGNPGRGDDGLGPALAARIEEQAWPGVTVEADYQLTVEDAAAVARHRVVIFADATVSGPAFAFRRVDGQPEVGFSTHSVSPAAVVALARELFGAQPEAYVLAIRGYEFGSFDEHLSAAAQANLAAAAAFVSEVVRKGTFAAMATAADAGWATAAAVPDQGD